MPFGKNRLSVYELLFAAIPVGKRSIQGFVASYCARPPPLSNRPDMDGNADSHTMSA